MSRRGTASSRLSVRGAFGLFKGGSTSVSALPVTVSRAQLFQLDKCLDKKALDKVIYQMQGTAAAIEHSRVSSLKRPDAYKYNVDGFASFLAQNKALSTLLFWKDSDEYACLFGDHERKEVAKKIFNR